MDSANERGAQTPLAGAQERVAMALFGDGEDGKARMVALCAEPGMGRREVLSGVLALASERGARVIRRDFAHSSAESACRSLVRLAGVLSNPQGPTVLGIEEIPPADEAAVHRLARAAHRMLDSGVSILCTLRPEARQLLEAIPECHVIGSAALTESSVGPSTARRVVELSHGIPRLVSALGRWQEGSGVERIPVAYYDVLGNLIELSLRPSLSDEERRLRLALLLLGKGTADDLVEVVGQSSPEVLSDIHEHAPLFGLAANLACFEGLSEVVPSALVTCLRNAAPTCALFPEVAQRCMVVLAKRGALSRAATLARLPECADSLAAVGDLIDDFVDAGEIDLVRRALDVSSALPREEFVRRRSIVASLDVRGVCSMAPSGEGPSGGWDSLRLFADARRFLWGKLPDVRDDAPTRRLLDRRLAAHIGACSLMLRGAFSAAQGMLVGVPDDGRGPSVSGALLAIDAEVARVMTGGSTAVGQDGVDAAREFLVRHPLRGLMGYLSIWEIVCALLRPEEDPAELERLVASCERSGDALVQVVALLAGSIADLRGRSAARAQVRASLAETAARGFDADYLLRVAGLIGEVARHLLGDRVEVKPGARGGDDLDSVCSFVRETMLVEGDPSYVSALGDEVPWDALWLVRMLCRGLGSFSEDLAERLPPSWKRAVSSVEPVWPPRAVLPRGRGMAAELRPVRPAGLVSISLLGGFSLRVCGQSVPDGMLERRNMKSMLEYLVLHGGYAKRFQIVEQVWPDCDYVSGFNRAYQTTSALRAVVADIDRGVELIVASRTSGEISVNMGVVDCDVSEFRREAREAVDSEDAERSLECARAAERLYAGDLYVPPSDGTGFIAAMRAELRCLYVDAMIEGSAAALSLGHDRSAARLAGNAVLVDNMREDAVTALVRALRACGRGPEAQRQQRSYEQRLARATAGERRGPAPRR